MEYRILKCKLLFFHHVAMLPEYTLAKEIFETQKNLHLPCLLTECRSFMMINNKLSKIFKAAMEKLCKKVYSTRK